MNSMNVERNIDLVFCIDGTGSMTNCIESVKSNAKKFYVDFAEQMCNMKSNITSLRIKIIVFRDYACDADAMEISEFFELPADQPLFERFLNGIDAHGGGDDNENGFEALCYAFKSDFYTGSKDRQVIVMFTDADALDLLERKGSAEYPADMVDQDGLDNIWACAGQTDLKLREKLKRLVVFAPNESKYKGLCTKYNRSYFQSVEMHSGLSEIDFKEIIKLISASASAV